MAPFWHGQDMQDNRGIRRALLEYRVSDRYSIRPQGHNIQKIPANPNEDLNGTAYR